MKGVASTWKKPDEVCLLANSRTVTYPWHFFFLISVGNSYAKIETETESAASPSGATNEMHSNERGSIEHHPSATETKESIYRVSAIESSGKFCDRLNIHNVISVRAEMAMQRGPKRIQWSRMISHPRILCSICWRQIANNRRRWTHPRSK